MKDEPLISIIIPVFNVERYLERCVESVLGQTYRHLEIFLVDDGSTDSSGEICEHLKKKDARIKVIHKINGGLSDARNAALDIVRGEWITFIDSDDWVEKKYVECLYEKAVKTNSQISIGSFVTTSGATRTEEKEKELYNIVMDNEEAISNLLYQKYYTTSAWGKLYKSELFDKIRFPVGKLYEDVETIYKVFADAERSVYTAEKLYYYFQRDESIVRTGFTIKKMDYADNARKVLEDVKKRYPSLEGGAASRLLWADIHILVHMDDRTKYPDEYKQLWKEIKSSRFNVLMDPRVRPINKLVMACSYMGINVLKILFNMKNS